MKMTAGTLFRRAAGMEDVRPLLSREAGQFEILKRTSRDRRDVAPMLGSRAAQNRQLAIGGHSVELQLEQGQRKFVELMRIVLAGINKCQQLPRKIPK
ncbi:MAG: hypothetical protein ACXWDN_14055 [Limisphaerales bacterium]